MESNWRFGIWDWGFTDANFKLIARLITPIGATTGVGLLKTGQFVRLQLGLSPVIPPAVLGPATKLNPFVNFPFGYNVFPD